MPYKDRQYQIDRCRERFEENPGLKAKHNAYCREYSRTLRAHLRDAVLNLYGRKCAKCGHTDVRVLQTDHIFGDGAEIRRRFNKDSISIMKYTLANPERHQLLCANCQWIKRHEKGETGYLPHKREDNKFYLGTVDRVGINPAIFVESPVLPGDPFTALSINYKEADMAQDQSADTLLKLSKAHLDDEEKTGTRPLMNWTRENAGAEGRAMKNLEKDPVGPVKARANTQARLRAAQATGGEIYNYGSSVHAPDKSENYNIHQPAPADRKP